MKVLKTNFIAKQDFIIHREELNKAKIQIQSLEKNKSLVFEFETNKEINSFRTFLHRIQKKIDIDFFSKKLKVVVNKK